MIGGATVLGFRPSLSRSDLPLHGCARFPPKKLYPFPLLPPPKYLSSRSPISPPVLHQNAIDSPVPVYPPKVSMASSTPSAAIETTTKPFSVLFVCLGNICRSPAAESVFRDLVKKRGLESNFLIDSAGTIDYHEGNLADPRMIDASRKRGIEITSISRPIRPSDFTDFDIILAMDLQNREDILEAFLRWKLQGQLTDDGYEKKVRLMCSYCKNHAETEVEVPDPYYGGPQGFEKVLDLLEYACTSLLDSITDAVEGTHISNA